VTGVSDRHERGVEAERSLRWAVEVQAIPSVGAAESGFAAERYLCASDGTMQAEIGDGPVARDARSGSDQKIAAIGGAEDRTGSHPHAIDGRQVRFERGDRDLVDA
jgi:hypothetical protein